MQTPYPVQVPPDRALQQMIMGFRTTLLLHIAAKIGLADQLANGPRTARELAQVCECHPDALYRVMRALANLGVLIEHTQQRFELAPLGEPLRAGAHGSLKGMAELYGEPWMWSAYGNLLHSVRTGTAAFGRTHGVDFFDYLQLEEGAARAFNAAMTSFSDQEIHAILAAYDFTDVQRAVDVGGGHGRLLSALLHAQPSLHGTLFDRPNVIEGAKAHLAQAGFDGRCKVVGGDFFESVPEGADLYLLKSVIHDWDDARACRILQNVQRALASVSGARVLLIERVVGDPTEVSEAKLFDINMLAMLGGRERTQIEHQALLNSAGLRLTRLINTSSPLAILEAMPI
jgi:hypothetical protein